MPTGTPTTHTIYMIVGGLQSTTPSRSPKSGIAEAQPAGRAAHNPACRPAQRPAASDRLAASRGPRPSCAFGPLGGEHRQRARGVRRLAGARGMAAWPAGALDAPAGRRHLCCSL